MKIARVEPAQIAGVADLAVEVNRLIDAVQLLADRVFPREDPPAPELPFNEEEL
jgi:hypothetical protein